MQNKYPLLVSHILWLTLAHVAFGLAAGYLFDFQWT
jgi:hypothetical protein